MNAEELLAEVEALGVAVTLDHEAVLLRPRSRLPPALIAALRAQRDELRCLVELRAWPEASREAVRRFGELHARLYPFLGQEVATSEGPGRLLQVFAERAAVLLHRTGATTHLLPAEIAPLNMSIAQSGLADGQVH